MKKVLVAWYLSLVSMLALAAVPAFAHVVVKPSTIGEAAEQTFSVSVPNERDSAVVGLRLMIPPDLQSVSPNVKPGWTINVKKSGSGNSATVTEIDWTGGSIPPEQRDDFVFSAQAPAKETKLIWKAYQTYENGDVVSWDQDPSTMKNMSDEDKEKLEQQGKGPFSQTKVINDLAPTPASETLQGAQTQSSLSLLLSVAAVALAVVAFVTTRRVVR